MKIRTNFVTNSSSYSSAEIKIDNPVLLEILAKYKEQGAFITTQGLDAGFMIGASERNAMEFEVMINNPAYSEEELQEELNSLDDKPVAFYFCQSEQAEIFYAPSCIEDVVARIFDVITDEYQTNMKNQELFKACVKELKARADEINQNYVKVSWETSNDGIGECEPEPGEQTEWEFTYDPENGAYTNVEGSPAYRWSGYHNDKSIKDFLEYDNEAGKYVKFDSEAWEQYRNSDGFNPWDTDSTHLRLYSGAINEELFKNTSGIEVVQFGLNTYIGSYAFHNCKDLNEINFKNQSGNPIIGSYAFSGCSNLKIINLPRYIEAGIGNYAFADCKSLVNVNLTDCPWLKELSAGMFQDCTSLVEVVLPASLKSIGTKAFKGCTSLKRVVFNGTLDEIGENAFEGCDSLVQCPEVGVEYGDDVWSDPIHRDYRYYEQGNQIVISKYVGDEINLTIPEQINNKPVYGVDNYFNASKAVGTLILPDTMVSIQAYTFDGMKNLRYIRLPEKLEKIYDNAFRGCSSLKGIYIPENVKAIYNNVFEGCTALENVYLANGKNIYSSALNTESSPNLVIHGAKKSPAEKFAKRIKAPFKADDRDRETIEAYLLAEAQGQVFDEGFWDYDITGAMKLGQEKDRFAKALKFADETFASTNKRPKNITQFADIVGVSKYKLDNIVREIYQRNASEWLVENGYIVPMTGEDKLAELLAELNKRYPEGSERPNDAKEIQEDNPDLKWHLVGHSGIGVREWLVKNGILRTNAEQRDAKKAAYLQELDHRETERQAQKLARLEELKKIEKRDESVLSPADLRLLYNTLAKLEQYYPEHKVFATDSLCENVRSNANKLTKKLSYGAFDEFLYVYGYENISGRDVYETRKHHGYKPGNEPELVKQRVDNSIAKLEELYPDYIIKGAIRHKNETLEYTVTGLYQWLGYENLEAFLLAYGFVYIATKGGGVATYNPDEMIAELLKRYPDGTTSKALQLVDENPDIPMMLLYKNANRDFGMSLQKYLEQVGVILGKKAVPEEAKANREAEKKRIEEAKRQAEEEKAAEEERIAQLVKVAKANRIAYKQNSNGTVAEIKENKVIEKATNKKSEAPSQTVKVQPQKAEPKIFVNSKKYFNKFEKCEVIDSHKKLLMQNAERCLDVNAPGCDAMIVDLYNYAAKKYPIETKVDKAVNEYKSALLPRSFMQVIEQGEKYAEIFEVDESAFNPKSDRYAEIFAGYFKHIAMVHAFKSFFYTIFTYCKKKKIEPKDISIEEIVAVADFIDSCGGTNFKPSSNRDDAMSSLMRSAELDYFFADHTIWGCFLSPVSFGFEKSKYVFSIDDLRKNLYQSEPFIAKIYNYLSENRDRSEQLIGCLADVLATWCTFAVASQKAFAVVKGLDEYTLERYDPKKPVVEEPYVSPIVDEDGVGYCEFALIYNRSEQKSLKIKEGVTCSVGFIGYPDGKGGLVRIPAMGGATEVILPKSLRQLSNEKSFDFTGVKRLVVESDNLVVGAGAFSHNIGNAEEIIFSGQNVQFFSKAFDYVWNEFKIVFGEGVSLIEEDALPTQCDYVVVKDSYAHKRLTDLKYENISVILTEAQKEALRREEEERQAREKARLEELERNRKLEEERRRIAEEQRLAEEKRIAEQRKAEYDELIAKKEQLLQTIAESRGLFGEKARRRKEAKAKLAEVESKLTAYPEFA